MEFALRACGIETIKWASIQIYCLKPLQTLIPILCNQLIEKFGRRPSNGWSTRRYWFVKPKIIMPSFSVLLSLSLWVKVLGIYCWKIVWETSASSSITFWRRRRSRTLARSCVWVCVRANTESSHSKLFVDFQRLCMKYSQSFFRSHSFSGTMKCIKCQNVDEWVVCSVPALHKYQHHVHVTHI